ncbi:MULTISPECIES: type II toxin-antitoxin system HicA family toxin [Spirulina sp. CCY15215]|uniref:type II toxin-antitoxin system HicA family toxin n=1 Tax=Spirulina sp. CCY15215 TaxID=2767591 RepID=UPI001951A531|nr:type II toxin-antitoxin system HicA family toxin [Spirulina major]
MGKLRVLSAKQICKILQNNGFVEIRQKGSHIIMQKQIENATISVVIPNYSEVKIGTLASIIRQSDLPRSLFEV